MEYIANVQIDWKKKTKIKLQENVFGKVTVKTLEIKLIILCVK